MSSVPGHLQFRCTCRARRQRLSLVSCLDERPLLHCSPHRSLVGPTQSQTGNWSGIDALRYHGHRGSSHSACGDASGEEDYPVHPDSVRQPGVPAGEVKGPFSWQSRIYPGTARDYWIYVPAQYDGSKPACVFVVQDGLNRAKDWKLPEVMDNLIHEGAMPVTIGVFINSGVVPAPNENAQPRFNRSFEYDSMGESLRTISAGGDPARGAEDVQSLR